VELGEVESALAAEPGVGLCAVVAKGAGAGDRRLVAYVVGAVDPGELKQRLRSKLPMHLVPSAIVRLEALPLTPVGKLDRQALARLEV
jgi:acyl-coenzyme A synthetase/AMP-(fatty) acid ligase